MNRKANQAKAPAKPWRYPLTRSRTTSESKQDEEPPANANPYSYKSRSRTTSENQPDVQDLSNYPQITGQPLTNADGSPYMPSNTYSYDASGFPPDANANRGLLPTNLVPQQPAASTANQAPGQWAGRQMSIDSNAGAPFIQTESNVPSQVPMFNVSSLQQPMSPGATRGKPKLWGARHAAKQDSNEPPGSPGYQQDGFNQQPGMNEQQGYQQGQGQMHYGNDGQGQMSYGNSDQGQMGYGNDGNGQLSYGDNSQGQPGYGDNSQGQPGYGDNSQGQISYGDNQGQMGYGNYSQGQMSYGDDNQGQVGYGDHSQGQFDHGDGGYGQMPYGQNSQGQMSFDQNQGQLAYENNNQGQYGYDPSQGQYQYGNQAPMTFGDPNQGQNSYGNGPQDQVPFVSYNQGQQPSHEQVQGQMPHGQGQPAAANQWPQQDSFSMDAQGNPQPQQYSYYDNQQTSQQHTNGSLFDTPTNVPPGNQPLIDLSTNPTAGNPHKAPLQPQQAVTSFDQPPSQTWNPNPAQPYPTNTQAYAPHPGHGHPHPQPSGHPGYGSTYAYFSGVAGTDTVDGGQAPSASAAEASAGMQVRILTSLCRISIIMVRNLIW